MRVAVISDTHLRTGSHGVRGPLELVHRLPTRVLEEVARAEVVLHAGDIVAPEVLDGLRAHAPNAAVHAVLGNNDHLLARLLPETLVVELGGVTVGMIHDGGPKAGRASRLHLRFPGAGIVVFGHSHLPLVQDGIGGQVLFNPGSPTQRRMAPTHTIGVLELEAGRIVRADVIDVDPAVDQ